jgi:DNA-binding PadR family transcriptional regulator
MEDKGWIDAEWRISENNRRAKFYRLTRAGRKQLEAEQQRWERMSAIIAQVMQGA